MTDIIVPDPTNRLVKIINVVTDTLILGVGEKVAIAEAVALQPWLGLPVISFFFARLVSIFAKALDAGLKKNIDIMVIRFQNDHRKNEYEEAIAKLQKDVATSASKEEHAKALQNAKDTMDKLINRNK